MSTFESGQSLLHFRIESKLGQGGMGEVYRALDAKLGRKVALKILPPWATRSPDASLRFREEARLASALNHPNIVTIYAVEQALGHEFIVMEYIEGETLLERARRSPLEFSQVIDLGIQVAEALAAAHALGLIHRDVKSANVLVTAAGQAKVADFGLAKRLEWLGDGADAGVTVANLSQTGLVMGTPAYMSPEQARGEPLDARTDVFSLAVALYEAATGRLPFQGPSALAILHAIATATPTPASEISGGVPPEFDSILSRALAKSPAERYPSAREFADALKGLRDASRMSGVSVILPREASRAALHNLPVELTSFVGRRRERAEVKRLFSAARLVTVMGVGGCGKTRLAIQVAYDMLADEPEGAWLVELGALADPELVPQAVAVALGVREEPGRPLASTLAEAIGARALLLVLDNCEHLAAASAALVEPLLRACPNLKVLATSQEGLGVSGEILWRIPTLSVPDLRTAAPDTKEAALRFEAIRLFVERAVAAQPSFVLSDSNAPTVAQICHRLDGIPLAIELAAVRVKVLSPEKILARLEDRFHLLTGGSRTALPRQQTLRAAVDWSYELLEPLEKTLLHRLGVFAGGCTLESAETVCGWDPLGPDDVLELLSHLSDKSLVGPKEGADGAMRYALLETIRAYARERAATAGETEVLAERHARFFLSLAESTEPELQGPRQAEWLNRLEEEHDNLRQAIQSFITRRAAEEAMRLCGALWRFWWIRGNWEEGRHRFESALAVDGPAARTLARSKALRGEAVLARGQGDYGAAKALLTESLEIAREQADKSGIASALFELGNIANDHDDLERARGLYEECLTIRREIDDRRGIALALHNLAVVAEARHEPGDAERLYIEALTLHRTLGNRAIEAATLNGLGGLASAQGDMEKAIAYQEQALAIQRELGDRRGIAFSLRELGAAAVGGGDLAGAGTHLTEAIPIFRSLGDKQGLAASMEVCAGVASLAGQGDRALRLAGAAAALREAIQSPIPGPDMAALEKRLSAARDSLGAAAADRAFQDGKALPFEESVNLAVELGSWAFSKTGGLEKGA